MSQQIDIVFKEELRGRNALHFWLGFATICFGLYFYFSQFFSAVAVDAELAPTALKSSYEARLSHGLSSTGVDGFGSTGTLSLLFDSVCLIGWATAAILVFMRRAFVGIAERLGFMSNGLLAWANRQQIDYSPTRVDDIKSLEGKVAKAIKNHEERLLIVEAKTSDMTPPPPPKTLEEIVAEQAEIIDKLQKAQKAKTQRGATNVE